MTEDVLGWLLVVAIVPLHFALHWRIDRGWDEPWNWRVFIGPWAYYPWLDRTGHRR